MQVLLIYPTDDTKKTEHLLALEGAKERLHLFKADLLEEESFDSVVDGCNGVFHTASPVIMIVDDPQVYPIFLHPCSVKFGIVYSFLIVTDLEITY